VRTLEDIWPVFGIRITTGLLELSAIRDCDIPGLVDLARRGIHGSDEMPFSEPWSTAPPDELAASMAAHYWRIRASFAPAEWCLELVVRRNGVIVGCQGFYTHNYEVTRTGETGSWLGREFQGQGTGTLMRQAMCVFLFDHLQTLEVASAAYLDNPASLAVSRKVGYRTNGQVREQRRKGEAVISQKLLLLPHELTRPPDEVQVSGATQLRRFIGLAEPPRA
jgi:RimJ/RimL family protein N-acetyltransferase